ncbi:SRPBCC domain-containing protein [Mucilaginibacter flavus]|nr:SRPBCC domain-containing protein [Mucilaginibacter flavus]
MQSLTISFNCSQTPMALYEAINNVAAWWGPVNGASEKVGDEFIYRHADIHYSKHRVTEMVPGKKVVWLTVDSQLNFVEQKDEWTGNTITFNIDEQNGFTTLTFTQQNLTPAMECYEACSGAWNFYVGESLRNLAALGQGSPDK